MQREINSVDIGSDDLQFMALGYLTVTKYCY